MERGKRWKAEYDLFRSYLSLLLVIPDAGAGPLSYLSDMVKEINQAHVQAEEVLSDCAYYYDLEEKRFVL